MAHNRTGKASNVRKGFKPSVKPEVCVFKGKSFELLPA